MKNKRKRILSGILALILVFGQLPVGSFAVQDGLCIHHTSHGDCGYSEGAPEAECSHVHGEACYTVETSCAHTHEDCGFVNGEPAKACCHIHDSSCGYSEGSKGSYCLHECGEACLKECVHTHDETCGFREAAAAQECQHGHDGQCGYREEQEAVPCEHICSEESGCQVKTLNCGHIHDAACGYAAEILASECSYICEICEGNSDAETVVPETETAETEPTEPVAESTEAVPPQETEPKEEAREIPPEPTATEINPLFAGVVTEEDLLEHEPPQVSFFAEYRFHTTHAQAAAELKEYMKERVNYVRLGYVIPIDKYTNAGFSETVNDILKIVYTHTGVPDEGDYLFGSYPGWSGSAPFVDYCSCGKHYKCYFDLTFTYLTTTEQEEIMDQRVDSLLRNLNPSGSDYSKVKTVYDWICRNIAFDYENLEDDNYRLKHSAYAALVDRAAVCSGFGTLLYRLALEMGVDCRYIVGNEGAHAWNIVRIGSLYYNLDASWDTGNKTYKYFLRNENNFSGHVRNAEYRTQSFYSQYPMGKYDYDPSAKITVTKQPADVWVYEGSTATISLEASGAGLTYQWYAADAGSSKFVPSSTFNGNSYYVQMNDARNGRQVYCRITDKYGNYIITDVAVMHMRTALKITGQPASVSAFEGETAKTTVKVQGNGLRFQWYFANAGSNTFHVSSTLTGSTYSVKMTPDRAGRRIYCVITDRYGESVRTDTVTLTMKNTAKIIKQPSSVRADAGEKVTVSLQAAGDGLTYKWYFANAGVSKFTLTNTYKGNTYSMPMDSSRSGRRIYCVVTDQYGNSVKSNVVTLSLKTPLKILKQPVSVKVAEGTNAVVSVNVQGDGLQYAWYYKNAGTAKFLKTDTFKGSTYSATMNETRNGRQLYCVISDAYGSSVTTNTVTISMRTPLKITSQPQSVKAAAGKVVSAKVEARGDGLSYRWYYANAGVSKFTLTNTYKGNTYKMPMDTSRSGRRVYCVVSDQYGNSVKSDVVTFTLEK